MKTMRLFSMAVLALLYAVTTGCSSDDLANDASQQPKDKTVTVTTTAVAKIAYVGSDNGEASPYNHGLALALSDANSGNYCYWKTSNTDAGHTKQNSASFTSESGLQYNATHNTDDYPAFKAAIANNGTTAPTGCSDWFLASGYQWKQMSTAAGGADKLGLKSDTYWSSSEHDAYSAWRLRSDDGNWNYVDRDYHRLVRSCLAF